MGILESALRQKQNVEKAKETKQAYQTLEKATNIDYDFSQWEAPNEGILSNAMAGFGMTANHLGSGVVNTVDKAISDASPWGVKTSLNDQEESILNKLSNQNNILSSINELDKQISNNQLSKDQLEQALSLREKALNELNQYQLNEEEEAIRNSPVTSSSILDKLNPLSDGKTYQNYDELLKALNQEKQDYQDTSETFDKYASFWGSNTTDKYNQDNILLAKDKLGREATTWDLINIYANNLTTDQVAQGIGSTAPHLIPYVRAASLPLDGVNVFNEGEDTKYANTNDALLSGEDLLKSAAAASVYTGLNYVGAEGILGRGVPKLANNPLAKIGTSSLTEGGTESLQTIAEAVAKGEEASKDEVVQAGVLGTASAGALSAPIQLASSAKPVQDKLKERVQENNPKTEEQLNEVVQTSTNLNTENNEINNKYNPSKAIETVARYYKGKPDSEENRAEFNNKINDILKETKLKKDNISEAIKLHDSGVITELEEQLDKEPDNKDIKEQLEDIKFVTENKTKEQLEKELSILDEQIQLAEITKAEIVSTTPINKKEEITSEDVLASPVHYTVNEISKVIENTTDENIKKKLRKLLEYKVEQNKLKDVSTVSSEVLSGNKEYIGINQYNAILDDAITNNDINLVNEYKRKLDNFYNSHNNKAEAIETAINMGGSNIVTREPNSNNWNIMSIEEFNKLHNIKGKSNSEILRETGSILVNQNTERLLHNIKNEVAALEATQNLYDNALNNFEDIKATEKVTKPVKQTTQINNSNNNISWSKDKGYEISSKGDSLGRKFSAMNAQLKDGRIIEEIYQLDIKGLGTAVPRPKGDSALKYNDYKKGKGKKGNLYSFEEQYQKYKELWEQYLNENPKLEQQLLQEALKKGGLKDRFATSEINQAKALSELLNERHNTNNNSTTTTSKNYSDSSFTVKYSKETPANFNRKSSNKYEEELLHTFDSTDTNSMIAYGVSEKISNANNNVETKLRRYAGTDSNKLSRNKSYTENDTVGYFVNNIQGKNKDNFIGFNQDNFADTSNLKGVAKYRIEELKAAMNANADIVMHNNSSKYKTDHQIAAEKYLLANGYKLLKPIAKELVFSKNPPKGVEVVSDKDIEKTLNHYNNNNNKQSTSNTSEKITLEKFNNTVSNNPEVAIKEFRKVYKQLKEEIKTNNSFVFSGTHLNEEVLQVLNDALNKARTALNVPKTKNSTNSTTSTNEPNKTANKPVISNNNLYNKKTPYTTLDNHQFVEVSPQNTGDILEKQQEVEINDTFKIKVKEGKLLSSAKNVFTNLISTLNYKRIANLIGLESLNESQQNQLKSFVRLRNFVESSIQGDKGILNQIEKADWRLLDDFFDGNVIENENLITAITVGIYNQIKTSGLKTHLSRKELGRIMFDNDNHYISKDFYKLYGSIGYNRAAVLQELGDKILSVLSISTTDNALITDREQLSVSLGILAFTVLQRESKQYGSAYTKPVVVTNFERLKALTTTANKKELVEEVRKYYTGNEKIDWLNDTSFNQVKDFILESKEEDFEGANYYTKPNLYINDEGNVEGSVITMDILKSAREIEGDDVISKLFEGINSVVAPSLTKPTKFTQKTIKNKLSTIPKLLQDRLIKSMQNPWKVKTELFETLDNLYRTDNDSLFKLLGLHTQEELDSMHPDLKEQIINEEQFYKEKLHSKFKWMDYAKKSFFYLNPIVWVNHRVGYDSYLINPQANILDRALVEMRDWESTIDTTEEPIVDNSITLHGHYLLGLAELMEGASKEFGFSLEGYGEAAQTVDKVKEIEFIPKYIEYLDSLNDEYKIAKKLFSKKPLSENETEILSNLIKTWDMGELGLTGLYEFVKYKDAKEAKNKEFTTYITRSSDGVTSGSLTGQTMYGAANDEFLLSGGYITDKYANEFNSLQDTKKAGIKDYYENIATHQLEDFVPLTKLDEVNKLNNIFNSWKVEYGTRKSAKVAANPFNYGSGLDAIADAVAKSVTDSLLNTYYKIYELTGKEQDEAITSFNNDVKNIVEIYNNLNQKDNLTGLFLKHNAKNLNSGNYINIPTSFNKEDIYQKTEEFFTEKYGSVTEASKRISRYNKPINSKKYLISKDSINESIDNNLLDIIHNIAYLTRGVSSAISIKNMSRTYIENRNIMVKGHNIANKLYEALKELYINNVLGKKVYSELTKEEVKKLNEDLEPYLPIFASTLNDKKVDNVKSGILLTKNTSVFENRNKVGIKYRGSDRKLHDIYSGFKYYTDGEIGVAGLALQVQSADSRVSSSAYSNFAALNAHDSNSTGLNDYVSMVKNQNQEHWKTVSEYFAGYETTKALLKPLKGLIEFTKTDYSNILNIFKSIDGTLDEVKFRELIIDLNTLDSFKVDSLKNTKYVHQYAGADTQGIYEVSTKDVDNMVEKFKNISEDIKEDIKYLEKNLISSKKYYKDKITEAINENDSSKIVDTIIDYLSDSSQDKIDWSWFNQVDGLDIQYTFTNKAIDNKAAHFSRLDNKVLIADSMNVDAIVTETIKAIAHNNLKEYKKGSLKNKKLQDTLRGMTGLSYNLDKLIDLKKLNSTEAKLIQDTLFKHKGDLEYLIATVISNQDIANILDKITVPLNETKDTILNHVLKFVSKLLGIKSDNTLKEIIINSTNTIISEDIKSTDKKSFSDIKEYIAQELSTPNLNYFTTGAVKGILEKLNSNNSISANKALKEIKKYLNNFKSNEKALIEQGLLPMVDLLERTLNKGTNIQFVKSLDDFPNNVELRGSVLSEEDKVSFIESGNAFTVNNTVYLVHPDVSGRTNLRASTIVHELFHVLTRDTLTLDSPIGQLYKEIKNDMSKSPNVETRYAATNLDEFVANTLSNYVVQRDIAEMVSKNRKSIKLDDGIEAILDAWNKTLPKGQGNALKHFIATFTRVLGNTQRSQEIREYNFLDDNLSKLQQLDFNAKTKFIELVNNYVKDANYDNFTDIVKDIKRMKLKVNHLPSEVFELIHSDFNIEAIKGHQQLLEAPVHSNSSYLFTPTEIFNTIKKDTDKRLNPIIIKIVEPLMSNIEPALIKGKEAGSVWYDNLLKGRAIYASEALTAGFKLNDAETFVLETTESALSNILDNVIDTPAYRKLVKAYNKARDTLTVEDFIDDYYNATLEEQQIAQQKYNYLFEHGSSSQDKSDYLTKFISLGLASKEMAELLNFVPAHSKEKTGLFEQAIDLLKNITDWIFDRKANYTNTDTINNQLINLSTQLSEIYLKNRDNVGELNNVFDKIGNKLDDIEEIGSKALVSGINKLSNTPVFKKTKLANIMQKAIDTKLRNSGKALNLTLDYINPNKPLGEFRSIINEILGYDSSEEHEKVKDLFTITKRIEILKQETFTKAKDYLKNRLFKDVELTQEQKTVLSKSLLRTDLQSLLDIFNKDKVIDLVLNSKERQQTIKELEDKLSKQKNGNEYLIRAKMLADYMVHRKVRNELLAKNATAIAHRVGIKPTKNVSNELIKDIDTIASLYALERISKKDIDKIKELDKEALSGLLVIHRDIAKDAKRDFGINPYSYIKGYLPNKTNPFRDVIAVSRSDIDVYKQEGYKEIGNISTSQYDNNSIDRVLMYISNNGQQRYISGAFSLKDSHKSGTTVYEGAKEVEQINKKIIKDFMYMVNTINYKDYETNVGSKKNESLIQSYDTSGNIISHSYEMTALTMDTYLDRVNEYDELLGQLAAQAKGNQLAPVHNKALVDYAIEEYKQRDPSTVDKFVTISPNSKNPKLRELWYLLPEDTKNYIHEKTGVDALTVKNDVVNLLFGYKKYSIFDHINKPEHLKKNYEKFLSALLTSWNGKTVKPVVANILAAWQESIKLLKDFVVVRGFTVIVGNLLSNTVFLMKNKFNPISAVKDINTALKYSLEYQKHKKELGQLEYDIKIHGLTSEIATKRTVLKDTIARNPLKGFIEAGMMPTIVNDVDLLDNDYTFQSDIQEFISTKVDERLPDFIKNMANLLFVNKNTKLHNFMLNATQQSDFVFRYAMYKQELKKGKSEKEALKRAKDTFIDYDVPTSKGMQFLNDMGLWMYTKFFLRIQRVVMRDIREKPLGSLAEYIITEHALGIPSTFSLTLMNRVFDGWNPFTFPVEDIMTMHEHAAPIQLLKSAT